MEKYFPHCGKTGTFFPRNGKTFSDFSTQWKNFGHLFPHNGKRIRDFSIQWKNFFHGVENPDLGLFSGVPGLFSGAVERSTRRPL